MLLDADNRATAYRRRIGSPPLTAGSWAFANQLRIISHKSVDDAEAIVFILNAADFEQPSQWQSEYQTPQSEPKLYFL